MIATQIIIIGLTLITSSTTIAGATCAFFCSSRGKTSIALLKDKKEKLEVLIHDLKQKLVTGAAVYMPNPSSWIEEAEKFLKGCNVADLEESVDAKFMNGLLPNCYVQKRAQTATENKLPELDGLIENGRRVSRELKLRGFKQLNEVTIVGSGRIEAKEKIWRLVSDTVEDAPSTICIHGAFGVGKTSIAVSIHNEALKDMTLFDHVIWVSLEYGGLWEVQEDIARSLVVDFSDIPRTSDTVQRARRLQDALLQKKNFLLVLDSMWKAFSLEDIGIPDLGNGCKMLVTSRISSVCKRIRGRESYELEPLPMNEAFELFQYESGPNFFSLHAETLDDTKRVVEESDGLPLVIYKLAQTLNEIQAEGSSEVLNSEWNKELARPDLATTLINNHEQSRNLEPFDAFKHSYDNLKEETRICFLVCALYPKDYPIDRKELIEYWIWEGLLGDIETLKRSMRKGEDTLAELKNAHLLEEVYQNKVKMLNLVRSMANEIMLKSGIWVFSKSGSSLSHLPLGDEWPPEVERASFIRNQISGLHLGKGPKCNRLSTLLLQHNPLTLGHDNNFFKYMPELKVLILSQTEISTLPNSLSNLKKLRALVLRACPHFRTIPNLSKLRELIVLDLSGTHLDRFPEGIQNMRNLRRLDLSQARVATFPANIVDKLVQLEELLMISTHDNKGGYAWRSKMLDREWEGACVEELAGLTHLTILELNFLDSNVFDVYVTKATNTTKVPEMFIFCVGEVQSGEYVRHNCVTITGTPTSDSPQSMASLLMLMSNLNVLDLSNLSSLRYLFTFEIMGSLTRLRELYVRRCKNMAELVLQPTAAEDTIFLPELTKIVLFDLPLLKSVCCGEVLDCPKLSSIGVWRCKKLKLPMIKSGSLPIRIRGERRWINGLNWDNHGSSNTRFQGRPRSDSSFLIVDIVEPEEFASPTRTILQEVGPNRNIIAKLLLSIYGLKIFWPIVAIILVCSAGVREASQARSWPSSNNSYNASTGEVLLAPTSSLLPNVSGILAAVFSQFYRLSRSSTTATVKRITRQC